MKRCTIIIHKGKTIIHSDLTNFNARTKEGLQEAMNQVKAEIVKYPRHSVLIITDVSGLHFDMEILNMFANYTKHNDPYIKASAVVGIAGLMQFVLYTLSKKALRDIHSFDNKAEALDWLVEQKDRELSV